MLQNYETFNEGLKDNIMIGIISMSLLNSCNVLKHKNKLEIAEHSEIINNKLTLTPNCTLAFNEFNKNIGNLPWPVNRAKVIGKFGVHKSEQAQKVTIDAKGITLATDINSKIHPIFNGEVSKIFNVCGEPVIIITHEDYYTVYSGIGELSKNIQIGLKVNPNTILGYSKDKLEFEVWKKKGKTPIAIDPLKILKNLKNGPA